MAELQRCLFNRRNILLLCVLLLVNVIFLFVQCNDTQEITLTGEALESYLEEYPEYIRTTLEKTTSMRWLGLLSSGEDFTSRNLEKTYQDFSRMSQVVVEMGENRGLVLLKDFELTDFLLVCYGIYLVLVFTGEYRKGLSLLIFSTRNGRRKLGIQRVLILVGGIFVGAVLLYGSGLFTVSLLYPGMKPERAIQSLPEFRKCTFSMDIRTYLLSMIGVKILAAISIALLLYACITCFRNMMGIVLGGLILLVQFLLYQLVLATSVMNPVKFLNLYALLRGSDGFSYYNLNLWGYPVPLLKAQLLFGAAVGMLSLVLVVIMQGQKPFEGFSAIQRSFDKVLCFWQRRKPLLSGFSWEGDKLLIRQGGLVIAVVVFYLAVSSAMKTQYRDYRDLAELSCYQEYTGPVTLERLEELRLSERKITRYYTNAQKNIAKLNEQLEAAGEEAPQYLSAALANCQMTEAKYRYQLPALRMVLEDMESAYAYYEKTGIQVAIMEPFSYELLFRDDEKTYQRNLLYCLILVILAFSGVMNYEKTTNAELLLNTMAYGRGRILRNKVIWIVVLSFCLSLPIHLIQYYRIDGIFAFQNQEAIVQSLAMLRNFPIRISLRAYIIGLYVVRSMISALAGLMVMFVSSKSKNRVSCIAVCMLILLALAFILVTK